MATGNYRVNFEAMSLMARRITEIWFAMDDADRIKFQKDINCYIDERILSMLDEERRSYESVYTRPERKVKDE